jgi:NTP pyrophosphatase (non-canonical NTP hydrolase)
MLEKLYAVSRGYNRRFPEGVDPFQMMTRLLEESGELANEVNHFEGTGVKRQKYGEPDKAKLAHEVRNVLTCALQVVLHYGAEAELEADVERAYQRLKAEGWLEEKQ